MLGRGGWLRLNSGAPCGLRAPGLRFNLHWQGSARSIPGSFHGLAATCAATNSWASRGEKNRAQKKAAKIAPRRLLLSL